MCKHEWSLPARVTLLLLSQRDSLHAFSSFKRLPMFSNINISQFGMALQSSLQLLCCMSLISLKYLPNIVVSLPTVRHVSSVLIHLLASFLCLTGVQLQRHFLHFDSPMDSIFIHSFIHSFLHPDYSFPSLLSSRSPYLPFVPHQPAPLHFSSEKGKSHKDINKAWHIKQQ